jgi:RimJ/RimL family protein N-acetyltransferase
VIVPRAARRRHIDAMIDAEEAPTLGSMQALTTPRLTLMPWQDALGEDLARLASDERVMQYIGNGRPWNREQARQRHQACLAHWADHNFGWRAILDSPSSRFLGLAALNYLGDIVPGIEESAIEIGWWLDPAAWGRGIATEAATAIRDEAFSRLHATRMVARLQPRNHASGRVAARLGMRLHGEAPGRTGEPVLVYLLDRPDWQASPATRAATTQNPTDAPPLPPAGRNE